MVWSLRNVAPHASIKRFVTRMVTSGNVHATINLWIRATFARIG